MLNSHLLIVYNSRFSCVLPTTPYVQEPSTIPPNFKHPTPPNFSHNLNLNIPLFHLTDLDAQPVYRPIAAAEQTKGEFLANAIDDIPFKPPKQVQLREPAPSFDGSDYPKASYFYLHAN